MSVMIVARITTITTIIIIINQITIPKSYKN